MSKSELLQEAKNLGVPAKGLARMKNADLELLIEEAKNTQVGVAGTLKHRILELHGEGMDKKEIHTQLTGSKEVTDWASQLKCGKIRMGYIYTVIRNAK